MFNKLVINNIKSVVKVACLFVLFLTISLLVTYKLFFNDFLIGRSLDSSVPPTQAGLSGPIKSSLYTWTGAINGGTPNVFPLTLLPANLVLYAPLLFNSTPELMSRYQIAISLTFSMFFFYYFALYIIRLISNDYKYSVVTALMGSIFFTLNNFFFSEIIFGSNIMYLCFAFFPLMLLYLLRYVERKHIADLFICLLALTIISSAIQYFVISYFLILSILAAKKSLRDIFIIGTLHLLLSLYWILPVMHFVPSFVNQVIGVNYEAGLRSGATKLYSALTNADYFGNRQLYTISLGSKFLSLVWYIGACALVSLCLLPLFKVVKNKNRKRNYIVLGIVALLLLSVFLIKGGNSPFGDINLKIYRNIEVFSIFRSLQRYISVYVMATSVLFLFSTVYLIKRDRRYMGLIVILLLINSMPWWYTRDIGRINIAKTGHPGIGIFKLAPGEEKLYDLANLDENYANLTIPPGNSVFFESNAYNPVRTQGGDPGLYFGKNKTYFSEIKSGNISPILNALEEGMYKDPQFLDKHSYILSVLNIKHVVIRKYVTPTFSKNARSYNINNTYLALKNSDLINRREDYPTITIAEIKPEYTLPHFYIPKQCLTYNGKIEDLQKYMSITVTDQRFAVYLKDQRPAVIGKIACSPPSNKDINSVFTRFNPTKYKVAVQNVDDDYPLVFLETYDQDWKAYITNIASGSIVYEIPQQNHIIANGYANGWLVNAEELCQSGEWCVKHPDGTYDMELIIEFWPQRLFYAGAGISLTTLALCVGYLVWGFVRKNL